MNIQFICNNALIETDQNPSSTLLDFVRQQLKLTGAKEGCREGDCGACAVLIGELKNDKIIYKTINSCLTPLAAADGKHVVTIEGINLNELSLVQQMFVNEGAAQCGFCTPGFIVSFTGFLLSSNNLSVNEAIDSIAGNLCRCTGHYSIIWATKNILDEVQINNLSFAQRLKKLVDLNIIPEYFLNTKKKLESVKKEQPLTETNDDASFTIAGGTDLYVQQGYKLTREKNILIPLKISDESIRISDNNCFIDAAVTIEDFSNSEIIKAIFPNVKEFANLFGSLPIRNRATVGGNIINASPIADITSLLLVLDAVLIFSLKSNFRHVKLSDFYKGYKQLDKLPEEILSSVYFEVPSGNYKISYEKVSKRQHLDIASVNSTMFIQTEDNKIIDVRISAGGVAPIPMLLKNTSSYLSNKQISAVTIQEASSVSQRIASDEIKPISDIRGSAQYKTLLLNRLILAHFIKLYPALFEEVTL